MAPSPPPHRPFRYRRSLVVAATPAELWAELANIGRYPDWWSWLRLDGQPGALEVGTEVSALIRPPLPYALHLTVRADTVDEPARIAATVAGDLEGTAAITIAPHPSGSSATITWDLRPRRPMLRLLAIAGRPLLEHGHNWIMQTGATQFQQATAKQVKWTEETKAKNNRWPAAVAMAAIGVAAAASAARWHTRSRRRRG